MSQLQNAPNEEHTISGTGTTTSPSKKGSSRWFSWKVKSLAPRLHKIKCLLALEVSVPARMIIAPLSQEAICRIAEKCELPD